MCQAVRDGGRRCPKHQHHNIVAINLATINSGLTQRQVETAFRKLRSEARGIPDIDQAHFTMLVNRLRLVAPSHRMEWVEQELAKTGEVTADHLNGASAFATSQLQNRANRMAATLNRFLDEQSFRTGRTREELKRVYDAVNTFTDVSREAETPASFTPANRAWAERHGLPFDRASVVATQAIRDLPTAERAAEPRITEYIPCDGGRWFQQVGYDAGRLEVTGGAQSFAYQNIPTEMFDKLRRSFDPAGYFLENIVGVEQYKYDNAEDAENDRYAYKCPSCGQFASLRQHTCPLTEEREEAAANNKPMPVAEEAAGETVEPAAEPEKFVLPEGVRVYESPAAGATAEPTVENQLTPPKHISHWDVKTPWTRDDNAHLFDSNGVPEAFSGIDYAELEWGPYEEDGIKGTISHQSYLSGEHPGSMLHAIRSDEERAQAEASVAGDGRRWFWRRVEQTRPAPRTFWYELVDVRDEETIQPLLGHRDARSWNDGFVVGNYRSLPTYKDRFADNPEVRRTAKERELATFNSLVETGEAVKVTPNATALPQTIQVDNQLQKGTRRSQLKVTLGAVGPTREALEKGRIAVIPVNFSYRTDQQNRFRQVETTFDDSQVPITVANGDGFQVRGNIAVARNPEGVILPVSTHRQLRCSCADYATNYHCVHVDHALRHIGNAVQQQIVKKARTVDPNKPERDPRVTAYFDNRGWNTFQTDPDTGEEYIPLRVQNVRFHYTNESVIFTRPEDWPPFPDAAQLAGLSRVEQVKVLAETLNNRDGMRGVLNSIRNLEDASQIRSALKRTSVEVPIRGITYYGSNWNLTGTVRFAKTAHPEQTKNLTVSSHTIKCSCPDYREDYDCIHVRAFIPNAGALLWDGRVNPEKDAEPPAEGSAYPNVMNQQARHALSTNREDGYPAMLYPDPGPDASPAELRKVARERFLLSYSAAELRRELNDPEKDIYGEKAVRDRAAEIISDHAIEWQQDPDTLPAAMMRDVKMARERREREAREAIQAKEAEEAAEGYRTARLKAWDDQDERYSENYNRFVEEYEAARQPYRSKKGTQLEFVADGTVTDGVCAPGGRGFGVEMEFTFDAGVSQVTALAAIGKELHEAGLTSTAEQTAYHTAAVEGYKSGKWSFETDETVAGELVSPILHDTPEHWEQIRKVCEIVKRHGGSAGTRAVGSHVNIGTGSYGRNAAKHRELVRSVNEHEDVLYRLATNPHRGSQRGTKWCSPLRSEDEAGVVSVEMADRMSRAFGFEDGVPSHGEIINLSSSGNATHNSRVEFRLWDGTLDPAVIQRQVAISAALVDAAEVHVTKEGASHPREKEAIRQLGDGYEASQEAGQVRAKEAGLDVARAGTVEVPTEQDAGLRNAAHLFDRIFRTSADRQRALELLAVTNWQRQT